eukprot:TRINITY_DN493_c0_g1_i1.p1 TRINITY_DN493_c0_g1~~TRINITY_DN493_c0_g1_i1.p1  ORF type:complete len:315 (-),score=43.15 TRINITY_DN493_c0_g1_i1:131-1075(-)
MSIGNNPIYKFLSEYQTKALKAAHPEDKVHTIAADKTVSDAMKIISENKILSLPVVKGIQVIGIIDVLDIASFVISTLNEPEKLEKQQIKNVGVSGLAIAQLPVQKVLERVGRGPVNPLHENSSAIEAVKLFASGIRRCPVYNDKYEIVTTLSQTDVIRLIKAYLPIGDLKPLAVKKISDLPLGTYPIYQVLTTDSVLHTLKVIADKDISAVPLVDPADGKIVANFSASDLKGLLLSEISDFTDKTIDYLTHRYPKSLNPVIVTGEDTLETVFTKIIESRVHRAWVVDPNKKPIGCISMTDLLKFVRDYDHEQQ